MESKFQITIGIFSTMTHLTQKSLRLYDEIGLLIPNKKDIITGYRYYSIDQVSTAIKIRYLIELGFALKEISQIIEAQKRADSHYIKKKISNKLLKTQLEIQRLKQIEKILYNNKKTLDIFYTQTMKPKIKITPKIRGIKLQGHGSFKMIPIMVNSLFQEIFKPQNQENFIKVNGPVTFINYNIDFDPDNSNFEVVVPINGRINISNEEIELVNIPKTSVISVLSKGGCDELHQTYLRGHEYVHNHQYEIKGLTRLLFFNNPILEKKFLVEFQIPININNKII